MTPLLSIIIPVYNAEKYLRETIDCIITQPAFSRCELLLINDGSRDGSLAIMREYEEVHPGICVIDKPNEGVSITRNRGIAEARGEYINFIDSDDLLHPQALEIITGMLEDKRPDILVWNFTAFYSKPKTHPLPLPAHAESLPHKEAFNTLMRHGCAVSLGIKAFRRECLKGVEFIPGMAYGEDMFFCWKAILMASTIEYAPLPLYLYRQSGSGATSRYHANLYENYSNAFNDLSSFIDVHGMSSPALNRDLDYHLACRLPALIAMLTRSSLRKKAQEEKLLQILADSRICRALESDPRLKGKIYSLARDKQAARMLANARRAALKAKILNPLKRLLK
ncbi:MAG: glycosyltransferase [Pseudoflavonifractor sp.]|nr:glycosyltransferase [Alloprevotella sp.]MCM1116083.1 glycosyltransferase [Pseudoflavonifractor sp.]